MTATTEVLDGGGLVHVQVTGKLTTEDYDAFVPVVDDAIGKHDRVRVLLEMRDFHGWTAGALWQDLKFGVSHFTSIERLAIVGEKTWQRGLAAFCKPFTMARVKYFAATALDDARAWLEEGRGHPAADVRFDASTEAEPIGGLLRKIDGSDGVERERAREEIVELGNAAIEPLVRAAQGGSWTMRLEATRALATLRDPGTAEVLARQLEDSLEIAWAASEGLKSMGMAGAKAVLRQVVAHADLHAVRVAGLHALRSLDDAAVQRIVAPVVTALSDTAPVEQAPVAAHEALQEL